MAASMTSGSTGCYGDKIRQKHASSKTSELQEEPKPLADDGDQPRSTTKQERYERVKSSAPSGFHELLQKVIRAVLLGRPVHVYRFIADLLDVELAQRTFDDIVHGCWLQRSKKLPPSECCQLMTDFLRQTKVEIYGEEQFTMGPIPDYELDKPALDRYRDYAGIGAFDMTVLELPRQMETPQAEELKSPPVCAEPEPEKAVAPPPPPPTQRAPAFDKGPIPEYDLQEPALDRYREFAGIEPFDMMGGDRTLCETHEPQCRCMFCSMKEGRRQITAIDAAELKKSCIASAKAPEFDPLNVFQDSPVYHEEKVKDMDAYKDGGLEAVTPFGDLFQQGTPFEEDVFEPECPYGEKSFMQQHPLFGDFGVKTVKRDKYGAALQESPECPDPEALNDDDDRYRLVESPEAENMDALNDPEEQEVVAKTPPVEDGFVDEAFDAPKSDEQPPQSFEPQDFVTTEEATENPTEEAPENP